jgi:hypothetical protein
MQQPQQRRRALLIRTLIAAGFVIPNAFAYADGTVSIQSLSPSATVTPGTTVYFVAATTGFTRPSFIVSDSASSTLRADDIFSSGTFYWTPTISDVGAHTLTVSVSDFYGNSASASQAITVSATSSLSIPSTISGSSITAGQPLAFSITPLGILNPTYTIKDSFNNSTVSNSNVSLSGNFAWTPSLADIGQHTLQIIGTDYHGVIASVSIPITVTGVTATIQTVSASSTIVGVPFSFSVGTTGFTSPVYLAYDSTVGTTFKSSNIDASGNVSWTPSSVDTGLHTINIIVSDAFGHSASTKEIITVMQPSLAISSLTPGSTVTVGTPVSFNLVQGSLAAPIYTIADSMPITTIASTSISGTGVFSWTPSASDLGTHILSISFSDIPGHTISTSVSIRVVTNVSQIAPQIAVISSIPSSSALILKKYVFTKVLSLGSSGDGVIALQKLLTTQGVYSGEIIGTFGPRTQIAVKLFQKKNGLAQVGSVGPSTRAALNKL